MVKNLPANVGDARDMGSIPGSGRFSWSRKWQPTPVLLPGNFYGLSSLAGYSPWGCKESDTTERLWTFIQSSLNTAARITFSRNEPDLIIHTSALSLQWLKGPCYSLLYSSCYTAWRLCCSLQGTWHLSTTEHLPWLFSVWEGLPSGVWNFRYVFFSCAYTMYTNKQRETAF